MRRRDPCSQLPSVIRPFLKVTRIATLDFERGYESPSHDVEHTRVTPTYPEYTATFSPPYPVGLVSSR